MNRISRLTSEGCERVSFPIKSARSGGRGVSRETRKRFPSGHEMLLPRYTAEYQRNVAGSSKRYPSPSSRSRYRIQGTSYYLFLSGRTLRACTSRKSNNAGIIYIINGLFICDIDYKVAKILFVFKGLYIGESDIRIFPKVGS